jgi:hypothetical protein
VGQYCAGSVPSSPAAYQAAFDGLRSTYTEWASADQSVPIDLPDGRIVWVFADTSVGHVLSGGVLDPSNGLARNSFVVQSGACFAPLMGGAPHARSSLIPDPAPNEWYWPTSGVVDPTTNTLRVFVLHEGPGAGAFPFTLLDVKVATFSLPGLALLGIQPLPFPTSNIPFGETSFLNPADGKVYLYANTYRNTYVARAPVGQLTTPGSWEFADGNAALPTWSTNTATAMHWFNVPALDPALVPALGPGEGPFAKPSVIPYGSGYLATAKLADAFSDDVSAFTAPSPAGPWTYFGRIGTTQVGGMIAYGAFTRLTLPGTSSPTIVYNTNVSPFVSNPPQHTIYTYGPHFVSPNSLPIKASAS